MSFTQETFAPVGANSTDAPAMYSYGSADAIAAITTAGYFEAKSFQLEEGDFVFVKAGDGSSLCQVQTDTSTIAVLVS